MKFKTVFLFSFLLFIGLGLANCDCDKGSGPCKQTKTVVPIDTVHLKYFPYRGGESLTYRVEEDGFSTTYKYEVQPINRYWDTIYSESGVPERQQTCDSTFIELFESVAIEDQYGLKRKIAYRDKTFYLGGLPMVLWLYKNLKNGIPYGSYDWLDSLEHEGKMYYNVLKREKTGSEGYLIYWNDKVGFIYHESRINEIPTKLSLLDYEI